MIYPLPIKTNKNHECSLVSLDSPLHPPSKISTTGSSMRLIERPICSETNHLNFLRISKSSNNSLDEDENNRKDGSPDSNNSCILFKRCAKIEKCFSFLKSKVSKNLIENTLEHIKNDEQRPNNFSLSKGEKQIDYLFSYGELKINKSKNEENEKIENTRFVCDSMTEINKLCYQMPENLSTEQKTELGQGQDFICKIKEDHIKEKLILKQPKIVRILSKKTSSKEFLENDPSNKDSEIEEMPFSSNSKTSFSKSNRVKMRRLFLEDFKEEEDEEKERQEKERKKEEKGYLHMNKKGVNNFADALKKKRSVNEFDLMKKYGYNDEIMDRVHEEEEKEILNKEELIMRKL